MDVNTEVPHKTHPVVELLLTDTTLDLSQKARVVRILETMEQVFY